MLDKLERHYDNQVQQLSEKEKAFFFGLKDKCIKLYTTTKPIMLAIATIYIFSRLKSIVGIQEAMFYAVVIQIVLLKVLLDKFAKLTG
jgi:hypothetical protein